MQANKTAMREDEDPRVSMKFRLSLPLVSIISSLLYLSINDKN
ncbi:hypothetical protein TPY_3027 [Sulfobacillus acidophilus TPY]|nr:hypothetical protein TPY_3027 [Sulfobacillus acidophilus TPY]